MSNEIAKEEILSSENKATEKPESHRCSALCTASSYTLSMLLIHFQKQAIDHRHFRNGNVVHRSYGSEQGDVFYFAYGTVVVWGLSKKSEQEILDELKQFEEGPIEHPEFEESRYFIGKAAKIVKDEITLPADDVLTKLAFAHGLSQSVKLSEFERRIERRIEKTKYAPESLAKRGMIPLSRVQLNKMMGELFIERNSVNLHTDILDTPEFFWEHSELEPLYRLIAQDLDISARVMVLNKRLDILRELFEMLVHEIDRKHSSSLEWIIIGLIFIEILLVVAKDIFKLI